MRADTLRKNVVPIRPAAVSENAFERGLHCALKGDHEGAINCFRSVLAANPDSTIAQYVVGLSLMAASHEREAFVHWQFAATSMESGEQAAWARCKAARLLNLYAPRN